MKIDLHTHTNFSDGSLSPKELIDYAIRMKVSVLGITDHDEVNALPVALSYAAEKPIEIVPGVELSIQYELPGQGHLHVLGLFIDYQNEELTAKLQELKNARFDRIREMVRIMNELGFNLDLDELIRKVGRGSAGRPHLARMLIEKGIVKDIPEAFNKYLSKGRPVHVPKMKLSAQQAFNLIHKAGGIAILAHPFSLGYQNYVNLGREILNLKKIGLDGLEAYYTNHDIYLTKWLINFAQENDLLISGGSDFHGKPRPDIEIGKGLGNLNIPYHIYENLKLYISD